MSWIAAFKRQAAADFALYDRLVNLSPPAANCHSLHMLQMALEKLTKALTALSDNEPPPALHANPVVLLRGIVNSPKLRTQLGFASVRAAKQKLRRLEPVAEAIHALVPRDVRTPNAEYPWVTSSGIVVAPIDEGHARISPADARLRELCRIAETLLRDAERAKPQT